MFRKRTSLYFCVFMSFCALLPHTVTANFKTKEKSSLTFVIDDSRSMKYDMSYVESYVDAIIDTALNSTSYYQIQDFVLVTFNDPGIQHRITTTDRTEFKNALSKITGSFTDGGDCPEMALSGIELALRESRPGSHLYVFTDASAKDFEMYGDVKNLAEDKRCSIVFVLTGDCSDEGLQNVAVYHQIARDTSGQVFNLHRKDELTDILWYTETKIDNRRITMGRWNFSAGHYELMFSTNTMMKEVLLSVSGSNPSIQILNRENQEIVTSNISNKTTFITLKLPVVKEGLYVAEVTSSSRCSVVTSADFSFDFEFSFIPPNLSSELSEYTRPISGNPYQILVVLQKNANVVLDELQVVGFPYWTTVIMEKSLRLLDGNKYISDTPIIIPNVWFYVVVRGHDRIFTNITKTRMSPPVAVKVKKGQNYAMKPNGAFTARILTARWIPLCLLAFYMI